MLFYATKKAYDRGEITMPVRQPRYTLDEAARIGDEIYNRDIKPIVEPDHIGKFVAVDIETGKWEMDADEMIAGDKMFAHTPDAQVWMVRTGYGYLHKFGWRGYLAFGFPGRGKVQTG